MGRSVRTVQTKSDHGQVTEHSTQAGVEKAIWDEIHGKRFFLAEQAPICQGRLRGDFGYLAVTPTATKVLNGTYVYPAGFDQSTKDLLQECARIRLQVPANSVDTRINTSQWQNRWKKTKEKTSSSISGLHASICQSRSSSIDISRTF